MTIITQDCLCFFLRANQSNVPFLTPLATVDVLQVGHLGEDYEEWVHQPIATKEGPRFFQSDFWEVCIYLFHLFLFSISHIKFSIIGNVNKPLIFIL